VQAGPGRAALLVRRKPLQPDEDLRVDRLALATVIEVDPEVAVLGDKNEAHAVEPMSGGANDGIVEGRELVGVLRGRANRTPGYRRVRRLVPLVAVPLVTEADPAPEAAQLLWNLCDGGEDGVWFAGLVARRRAVSAHRSNSFSLGVT
jgi:hypothetical protein